MMNDKDNKKHIQPKRILIVVIFMAAVLIVGIRITDKQAKDVNYLEYHETLDTTYVVHPVGNSIGKKNVLFLKPKN